MSQAGTVFFFLFQFATKSFYKGWNTNNKRIQACKQWWFHGDKQLSVTQRLTVGNVWLLSINYLRRGLQNVPPQRRLQNKTILLAKQREWITCKLITAFSTPSSFCGRYFEHFTSSERRELAERWKLYFKVSIKWKIKFRTQTVLFERTFEIVNTKHLEIFHILLSALEVLWDRLRRSAGLPRVTNIFSRPQKKIWIKLRMPLHLN